MSYTISLTADEQKELLQRKKNQRDGKVLRRLMCIDMKQKGILNKDIAEYCSVCIDTITDWLCLFKEGSFEALCSFQYEGRRISKLEKYKEKIKIKITEKEKGGNEGIVSLKELKAWVLDEFGIKTCISNLFYFCKKNSIYLTKKPD